MITQAGLKALEDEFANRMMQFFLDHLNVQIKQQVTLMTLGGG